MLKNYFKTAWRNIVKSKTYSLINITGLSVGLACFIITLLYLDYELSYDRWHPDLNQVYKIGMQQEEDILEQTPAPLGKLLQEQLPIVETTTTISSAGSYKVLLGYGDKKVYQPGSIEANTGFFKVFPYKIIKGDAINPLEKPNAIVLEKEVAYKLFGNEDPIGKKVKVFSYIECEVTAIMEEPVTPVSLDAKMVWRSPYEKRNFFWENYSYETYIKTKQPITVKKLDEAINEVFYTNRLKKDNNTLEEYRKAGNKTGLFADVVTRIHNFPAHGNSNFKTVTVLMALAILLLVAGAINFSNLSIAASIRRAKEVGVRKVLGSGRRRLSWQFMFEIAVQCLVSLGLAIIIVKLILPWFNNEFGLQLSFGQPGNFVTLSLQVLACLFVVIILSGLYPAAFLSYFNVLKVLKGNFTRGNRGKHFRNALIVAQFTVAALFIIGTIVISRQMNFMKNSDKGFSGEQVMRIETIQKTREQNFETTRNQLLAIPGVQYVSKSTNVPGDEHSDSSTYAFKYEGEVYRMSSVKISPDYFNTLHIELVKGRFFNDSYADNNTRTAILNESAAKKLNLGNTAAGTIFFNHCDSVPVQIVGIVKDFHVTGFESHIQPVVYTMNNKACMFQSGGGLLVKLNSDQLQSSVAAIEKVWKTVEPEFPIRYSFLDDNFQQLLLSYTRLQNIINAFAGVAIFISIMGLFALTAFLTNQRAKEIGIRKVLGANVGNLATLLSKDFLKLVILSVIIAAPVGWWACSTWLQSFAYRITMQWWLVIVAALVIVLVALFTISIQIIKAALANPVKALRAE